MSFAVSIPQNLKYKRFNKRFSKISSVCEEKFNQVQGNASFICGLKCLDGGFLSVQKIHQYILLLRRAIGKGRIGWSRLRLFLNIRIPKTSKSAGHRMGKGKGAVRYWGMSIKKGAFLFKIKNSPFKFSMIDSFSWSFIYAVEEFIETYSFIVFKSKINLNFYKKKLFGFALMRPRMSFYITFLLTQFKTMFQIGSKNLTTFTRILFYYSRYLFTSYCNKLFKSNKIFLVSKKAVLSQFFLLKNSYHFKKNIIIRQKNRIKKPKKRLTLYRKKRVRIWLIKQILRYLFNNITSLSETTQNLWDVETLGLDFDYLETKAYIEQFQKYPDFRISYYPSLFRGLFRIKKKLPFKSEIIFFSDKAPVYKEIKSKRTNLKHINQK